MHPRTREIASYLDEQRRVLQQAFDSVPRSQCTASPRAGAWSAVGIIEHLSLVEARLGQALAATVQTAKAEGVPRESETTSVLADFLHLDRVLDRGQRIDAMRVFLPTGKSAEESWAALEAAGGAVREALRAGDGLALDTRSMPHPVLGQLSVYHMFAFVGAHEARHAAQIREIAAHFTESR